MIEDLENILKPVKDLELDCSMATVVNVTNSGVIIQMDGNAGQSTEKAYNGNPTLCLKAGDRVKIDRTSGTAVIAYKIGVPKGNIAKLTSSTASVMMAKINEIIDRLNG